MENDNWKKVKEVLDELLAIAPEDQRAYLQGANLSAETRAEIESLLAFQSEAEGLMDISAAEFSREFFAANNDAGNNEEKTLSGQMIGIYRIVRELGHGGMGAVYLAERADGKFEQKVALKLLKRELNTSALRRRFEQERQILASLEHPGIARLLDAGTTDDSVPYIAMEYVEGLPIDEYCRGNKLSLDQTLDLFRKVCAAVDFAHRNLIVHRDLKPSNILVNRDGTPKLLDFGISKIVSEDLSHTATVTGLGAMTPNYASPEQLENKSVTTATDVYSLGVVLYELLSGRRPFSEHEGRVTEFHRAVIENDPAAPSSVAFVVQVGGIERQYVRGDLDNIALKALKKEPERRYSSVENLAEDIRRHQEGLTVSARPDVFSYRAAKFIGRNKLAVGAGLVIILAVFSGVIATLWQARVAAAERDRAQRQAHKTEKINAYMHNILNFNNPHWLSSNPERNLKATVAEAMDEALKNIDTDLANEPEIQAELLFTLAVSYNNQGQYAKAEGLLRRSIEKFNEVHGPQNLRSMQASVILADSLYFSSRLDEAVPFYTAAIDYFRPLVAKDKGQSKWLIIALNDLGNVLTIQGKFEEAENLTRESINYVSYVTGQDRFIRPIVWANMGGLRSAVGDMTAGIEYFNKALDEMRAAGTDERLEGAFARVNLGKIYNATGDYQKADELYQKAYQILNKTMGDENIFTLLAMHNMANNYYWMGNDDAALAEAGKALQILQKIAPNGHFMTGFAYRTLAAVHTRRGELKKGEEEIRAGLSIFEKRVKEPNQDIALLKETLGENLAAQKRYVEAREALTSALENNRKTRGEEHPFTKRTRATLEKLPSN